MIKLKLCLIFIVAYVTINFSKFHHRYPVARKLCYVSYNYYDIAHVYLHACPGIIIRHISRETRELFTSVVDKIQLKNAHRIINVPVLM